MKIIEAESIVLPIAEKIMHSLCTVDPAVVKQLECALPELSGAGAWALKQIIDNDILAAEEQIPACQDTGLAVFFVEIGRDAHVSGDLRGALNAAVRKAYAESFARKSVVKSPLSRENTGDNTPAIVHYDFVDGDRLRISFLSKGAGAENMSTVKMLPPSKGKDGVIAAAVDCVRLAGGNPCPPIILGLGLGGDMELAAILSKKALLRPHGTPSADPDTARLEEEILAAVNATDIGIQGFGGPLTALSVAVETAPTHIGMLPVAINLQCHSVRHFTITIG